MRSPENVLGENYETCLSKLWKKRDFFTHIHSNGYAPWWHLPGMWITTSNSAFPANLCFYPNFCFGHMGLAKQAIG